MEITERIYKEPMGTLRVTVRDVGSPTPTAARVTLYAADGKVWVPPDAYARIGQWGSYPAFHTTGSLEVQLPPGEADLTFMKGFEREPQRHRVMIHAGQLTRLEVEFRPLDGPDLSGWYNGSTHMHMNYGGNLHNSLENLMMMADAEDLDVVNELVANKDNRVLDHQFFRPGGEPHPLSTPTRILMIGEEYRPGFYGHVSMLGLTEHLLSPFTTGYEGTALESLYPSNTDMLRKAKAQGAMTAYVHPFSGDKDPQLRGLRDGRGFMVDAALGTVDALEWSFAERGGFFPLYALWNNDIRVAAIGGEDSISDLHRATLVGAMRTYVRTLDGRLSAPGWNNALKCGHAFVTNSPLLSLNVDGRIPGEEIELPAGGASVRVEVRVGSIRPLTRVWLVMNGEDVADVALSADRRSASLVTDLEVTQSGWIHLRAEGEREDRFPLDAAYPQAFTNPVWVAVGGQPIRDRESAEYGLHWVDALEEMALEWPGWRSQAEIDHVLGQFEEARQVYLRLAAEAGG